MRIGARTGPFLYETTIGCQGVGLAASSSQALDPLAHSCARLNDGTVYCWGSNATGQLGLGAGIGATELTPKHIANLWNVAGITLGYDAHLRADGGRRRQVLGQQLQGSAR